MLLLAHNLVAECDNFIGVLLAARAEESLVDGIVDGSHQHTHNTDYNAGDHRICNAHNLANVGHNKAHAAAHNDGADGAEHIRKHVSRTLYLRVQFLELVKRGKLLLGVLSANFLHEEFLIVFIHCDYLFLNDYKRIILSRCF